MDQYDDKKEEMIINLLVDKCIKDENFKKKLIESPSETIEKEFNIQIPKELENKLLQLMEKIIEKTNLSASEAELTDLQIEQISGAGLPIQPVKSGAPAGVATVNIIKALWDYCHSGSASPKA